MNSSVAPSMLQLLSNDAVFPFFWNLRRTSLTAQEVTFLDLETLKQELRLGVSHVAKSDSILESVLYGSTEQPHLSGWTQHRLAFTAERSGFKSPEQIDKKGAIFSAILELKNWDKKNMATARAWRREQKLWAWRKSLRAKAGQRRAQLLGLFSKPDLTAKDLNLNLGAGSENYAGFLKVDLAGEQNVYDNIVTLSKFKNHSVSSIYCNHVLEHIPESLIDPMLKRWREILKPGGTLRARTPDARRAILCLNETWQEASDQDIIRFNLPNFLARENDRSGVLSDDACIQTVYGWSNSTPHAWDLSNQHKSLWTPHLARKRFESAGFEVLTAENLGTLNTLVIARAP